MTMSETEQDIIKDLTELTDPMDAYSFLLACGKDLPDYPDSLRTEEYLIRDCQVNTWLSVYLGKGRICLLADSESLIVRGALSFLYEIYQDRSISEIRDFHCSLISNPLFTAHFTEAQLKGLLNILQHLHQITV